MHSLFDDLADQVVAIDGVLGLWLLDAAGDIVSNRIRPKSARTPDPRVLGEMVGQCGALGAGDRPVWFVVHAQQVQILVRWLDLHALLVAAEPQTNLAMVRVGISGFNLRRNYPSLPPMMLTDQPELSLTPAPTIEIGISPPKAASSAFDASDVSRVTRCLTDVIGPYAKVVVRRERDRIGRNPAHLTAAEFEELIKSCAVYIDNLADRQRFERRAGGAR